MKRLFLSVAAILAVSSCAFAQEEGIRVSQSGGSNSAAGPVTVGVRAFGKAFGPPIQGAPYSATMTNEFVQTLADGNRINQSTTGVTARDSQGRTRQDMSLPPIGGLSAKNAPRLVFIQDPVAQTSYTLNLADKTAEKMTMPGHASDGQASGQSADVFFAEKGDVAAAGPLPPPLPEIPAQVVAPGTVRQYPDGGPVISAGPNVDGIMMKTGQGKSSTEDLGSQNMEGVFVTGVRTTLTIPAGQIGNEQPISVVTEVWTSPELKTAVYSKRTDPRMGEQIFKLTNISRSEPDASLFIVPPDFKVTEGPKPIIYHSVQ
jgi:hypothetical protein